MYAVFGVVEMLPDTTEEGAIKDLKEGLIPGLKLAPGFIKGTWFGDVNPPGESGDSMLIETMLPHHYSGRHSESVRVSLAAYLRSIQTSAGC